MSGICGVINFSFHPIIKEDIETMCREMNHRGAEGTDYFYDKNVGFGFLRPRTIGLQDARQPFFNERKNLVMLCSGTLFNYAGIKKEMEAKGHHFTTESDVEVIIHLYEEHGIDFLNLLNGQFAFVIYNIHDRTLFCARDHVGIMPFYYTVSNKCLVFASEIKALLKYPSVEKRIDLDALNQIMHFPGFVSPKTLIQGIISLPAGHMLCVAHGKSVSHVKYWDYEFKYNDKSVADEVYIENLDSLLDDAIQLRLRDNVSVGLYLSGGLDSSLIAYKAVKNNPMYNFNTYSIDFASKNISEKKYQDIMRNVLGSNHHDFKMEIQDIADLLEKVVYHSESVLKETYNTANYILSKMAKAAGNNVILTGEGSDELFAGYVGYQFDVFRRQSPYNSINAEERSIQDQLWGDPLFLYEKEHHKWSKECEAYFSEAVSEKLRQQNGLLPHSIIDKTRLKNADDVQRRSYMDLKLRLPDHLLCNHGDKMAYANSIEARYPFLDRRIVEFALSLPSDLKIRDMTEKYIVKQVSKGQLPSSIWQRPKFAFVAPGSTDLLRLNRDFVEDILSYDTIKRQGYLNANVIETLKNKYLKEGFSLNLPYDSDMLIVALTLGLFLKVFNIPDLT